MSLTSSLGCAEKAVSSLMAMCQEKEKEKDPAAWLELALALFRQHEFVDSHKGQ